MSNKHVDGLAGTKREIFLHEDEEPVEEDRDSKMMELELKETEEEIEAYLSTMMDKTVC